MQTYFSGGAVRVIGRCTRSDRAAKGTEIDHGFLEGRLRLVSVGAIRIIASLTMDRQHRLNGGLCRLGA